MRKYWHKYGNCKGNSDNLSQAMETVAAEEHFLIPCHTQMCRAGNERP